MTSEHLACITQKLLSAGLQLLWQNHAELVSAGVISGVHSLLLTNGPGRVWAAGASPALRAPALWQGRAQPAVSGSRSILPRCPAVKEKLEKAAWSFSGDLLGWFVILKELPSRGWRSRVRLLPARKGIVSSLLFQAKIQHFGSSVYLVGERLLSYYLWTFSAQAVFSLYRKSSMWVLLEGKQQPRFIPSCPKLITCLQKG